MGARMVLGNGPRPPPTEIPVATGCFRLYFNVFGLPLKCLAA